MGTDVIDRLKSAGWVPRFTASGTRLQEAIENYQQLGFEVKTIPAKDVAGDSCTECLDDKNEKTEMLFTRESKKTREESLSDNMGG